MIRRIATFRCDTFSTNYVAAFGKKEEHDEEQRRRRRRRRSIPETPPMRIFSSAARASLRDSHAIDLFPYRRLIPVSACGAFLPSFLPPSLSLSLPLRVRVTARTAELRTYYASIEFYFNSKSSLEISEHVLAKVGSILLIRSTCNVFSMYFTWIFDDVYLNEVYSVW